MSEIIKVLIVDDSELAREIIKNILEKDPAIRVVGIAENGLQAIEYAQRLKPDVITMDINMPVMDGLKATEQIMAYCPTPILVLSSVLEKEGAYTTFNALAAGAVDAMEKPSLVENTPWDEMANVLVKKVKLISKAQVITHIKGKMQEIFRHKEQILHQAFHKYEIIAIGASTGGPSIVMQILKNISPGCNASIVIVQHMATGFTESFVEWLGNNCKLPIKLAREGEKIERGHVFVAPDGCHTIVREKKTFGLIQGETVNGVKPSVDILFNSLAEVYGDSTIAVLLTGMGADGAKGLKHIKDRGGFTIAQSEESCTVFGMPKVAIEMGAVNKVLSIEDIIYTLNTMNKTRV